MCDYMLEQKAHYKDLVILKDDTHQAFGCYKQDCVIVEGGTMPLLLLYSLLTTLILQILIPLTFKNGL
jgi:hypothetical protein